MDVEKFLIELAEILKDAQTGYAEQYSRFVERM